MYLWRKELWLKCQLGKNFIKPRGMSKTKKKGLNELGSSLSYFLPFGWLSVSWLWNAHVWPFKQWFTSDTVTVNKLSSQKQQQTAWWDESLLLKKLILWVPSLLFYCEGYPFLCSLLLSCFLPSHIFQVFLPPLIKVFYSPFLPSPTLHHTIFPFWLGITWNLYFLKSPSVRQDFPLVFQSWA